MRKVKPVDLKEHEIKVMQQFKRDINIYGVVWQYKGEDGKMKVNGIEKGGVVPASITPTTIPTYRRMTKSERRRIAAELKKVRCQKTKVV